VGLSPEQQATLKAAILADATLNALPNNPDGAFEIARLLDAPSSPAFIVWRTSVSEHEITGKAGPTGTTWSWPAYIARSIQEQNGWARMLNTSLTMNPSLANVRQGMADIFSGSTNSAPAQRAHLTAVSKRTATKAEKIFASGTGTDATPATMTFEGRLSYDDVQAARNLP
jgi:hypothetical protein